MGQKSQVRGGTREAQRGRGALGAATHAFANYSHTHLLTTGVLWVKKGRPTSVHVIMNGVAVQKIKAETPFMLS